MRQVEVYDTTLRDGCQAERVTFSLEDKLRIAERLDDLGIHYIEGGWPNPTNPKDVEFFQRARKLNLKTAKISAFGSTRRGGGKAAEDEMLRALLEAETEVVAIFGKSWDLHVEQVLRVSLDENLKMIEDSVSYLVARGRTVIYDAEHFYDGFLANKDYALKTIEVAQEAGASCVVLCDTNGGMLPHQIHEITSEARAVLRCPWGIHAHNDSGCAAANTAAAVELGATHVQGTINGYGERCGNANLCTVIPNMMLKQGVAAIPQEKLAQLTALSRFVSELANLPHDHRQPYVGASAFAHKGGAHADGVAKVTRSFEHIEPALVGNVRRFLLSEQAGSSTIVQKLQRLKPSLNKKDPVVRRILGRLKELEHEGYEFEAAEASFELLARKELGEYEEMFTLQEYRIIDHKRDGGTDVEATIRVRVGDEVMHTVATGVGPVHALDRALRKALQPHYPEIAEIELVDYKVRVLAETEGTETKVRVLITTSDGQTQWGTVGASRDVVEASWEALADSLAYGLLKRRGRVGDAENPKTDAS